MIVVPAPAWIRMLPTSCGLPSRATVATVRVDNQPETTMV